VTLSLPVSVLLYSVSLVMIFSAVLSFSLSHTASTSRGVVRAALITLVEVGSSVLSKPCLIRGFEVV
jgi:hypothetical protein